MLPAASARGAAEWFLSLGRASSLASRLEQFDGLRPYDHSLLALPLLEIGAKISPPIPVERFDHHLHNHDLIMLHLPA